MFNNIIPLLFCFLPESLDWKIEEFDLRKRRNNLHADRDTAKHLAAVKMVKATEVVFYLFHPTQLRSIIQW